MYIKDVWRQEPIIRSVYTAGKAPTLGIAPVVSESIMEILKVLNTEQGLPILLIEQKACPIPKANLLGQEGEGMNTVS